MRRILYLPGSPLGRHPSLMWRKIWSRLGMRQRAEWSDPPLGWQYQHPSKLRKPLLRLITDCGPLISNYPFTRVFKQDFKEEDLWKLCRCGPKSGDSGLPGDIKLPWEFSRGYACVLRLAAQPDQKDISESVAHFISKWLEVNTDPNGIAWSCAMETAIRAVNWIVADILSNGQLHQLVGRAKWEYWLWNHAYLIDYRLEARAISSNHYIADLLGLCYISYTCGDNVKARRWYSFATKEMERAIITQTHTDGGANEASLPYHALITEMTLLFCLISDNSVRDLFGSRLQAMCQVVADHLMENGDLPQVGDNDGGRVLALDYISNLGRAEILLKLAEIVTAKSYISGDFALYPRSGWWVGRCEPWTVHLEFGGVGLGGRGAHAHNDDLSLCVAYHNKPVLVDPGSGIYTPNPVLRNRLRSVTSHNTVAFDDLEPTPIPSGQGDSIFSLRGRVHPLKIIKASSRRVSIEWHNKRVQCLRSVHLSEQGLEVEDVLSGQYRQAAWRFHLPPDTHFELEKTRAMISIHGAILFLEVPEEATLHAMTYPFSPYYGAIISAPCLRFDLESGINVVRWSLKDFIKTDVRREVSVE